MIRRMQNAHRSLRLRKKYCEYVVRFEPFIHSSYRLREKRSNNVNSEHPVYKLKFCAGETNATKTLSVICTCRRINNVGETGVSQTGVDVNFVGEMIVGNHTPSRPSACARKEDVGFLNRILYIWYLLTSTNNIIALQWNIYFFTSIYSFYLLFLFYLCLLLFIYCIPYLLCVCMKTDQCQKCNQFYDTYETVYIVKLSGFWTLISRNDYQKMNPTSKSKSRNFIRFYCISCDYIYHKIVTQMFENLPTSLTYILRYLL